MQNYTKGIIYASITAFFWGFLAIALKVAVREVEPVTIVWFRFSVAFVMLSVWQLAKNQSSFRILKRPPLLLILAGVALSWNYLGYMMGIHYTTPSNAQLFIQTGPIILAVAGLVFFREKLKRNQIIGFSIAIIGFMFFYRDQLSAFFESQEKYNLGVLLTISGAVAWATYAVSQKQLVTKYSAESLNLFLFGFPALIYLPFTDLTPLLHLHWTWWLLMIFLGANTFIAYSCLALALKYLEANKVSVIIIVNPMITFITMGILTELNVNWVAHERFSIITILGAVLVFAGAVLVVKRQRKNKTA
ncbi:MAG: DMT family transporter [Prolixibacteraceae bacterium]|nr:DMT family transporter [Prolixibacteraceae bacterium]